MNPGGWTRLQTALVTSAYLGTLALAGWLGWLLAVVSVTR